MYILVAIACWISFFYLLGVKAPLFLIALSSYLGVIIRKKKSGNFFTHVAYAMLSVLFLALFEIFLFNYFYIAGYFIRRVFTVPPYNISAFFDFMKQANTTQWTPMLGINSTEPATFFIGEHFLNMDGLNANTNAFIYALGSGGTPLYLGIIILVCLKLTILDLKYRKTNNPILIFTAFLYSILILEQSATTALVTSGLGILFAFLFV